MNLKKLINFPFYFIIFISFLIFLLGFNNLKNIALYSYFLFFISFILIFTSFYYLKFSNFENKINFFTVILFTYITLSIINFFIILNNYYNPSQLKEKQMRIEKANELGIEFDKRTRLQVIEDYRKNNKETYGVILPSLFSQQYIKKNLFPLSGISNVFTVYGNETGEYLVYKSDRYGFNNEDYVYDQNEIDFLIIGDSFAHGANVKNGNDVASILRKKGYSAVTIGMGANGPLTELASMVEYGVELKPKIILWFLFSNDLNDLVRELQNPILKNYLSNENFNQDLINKQKEIDLMLKEIHEIKISEFKENEKRFFKTSYNPNKFFSKNNLKKFFTLYEIRALLNIDKGSFKKENKVTNYTRENFKKIFKKACSIADKNNSQIFIVNLPSYESLDNGKSFKNDFIKSFIKNFFVEVIDFGDFLLLQNDFRVFFPLKMIGHYTREGYENLSNIILDKTILNESVGGCEKS